jgi:hypothetical protein
MLVAASCDMAMMKSCKRLTVDLICYFDIYIVIRVAACAYFGEFVVECCNRKTVYWTALDNRYC